MKYFSGRTLKSPMYKTGVHRAIANILGVLLITVTNGLPTFSRVYTRIDVFLYYYSLLYIFNIEMSNTSNRYGFRLRRATFSC